MKFELIRERLESDSEYRNRMQEHYELHKGRFHADFDSGRWPERHHSHSNFFWGMALAGEWDAIMAWRPELNTPNSADWKVYVGAT